MNTNKVTQKKTRWMNTCNVPDAVDKLQTMVHIYPQTLDIQYGTPDLQIALIVEAMEKTKMI